MESHEINLKDHSSRLRRLARALCLLMENIGRGFAQDNRGLEFGSRENRIVAITNIPDHIPDDWET